MNTGVLTGTPKSVQHTRPQNSPRNGPKISVIKWLEFYLSKIITFVSVDEVFSEARSLKL